MTTPHERNREEEAIEALIVAAFRSDQGEEEDGEVDLTGPEPRLSEEDERALAALGPNLVAKIIAGRSAPPRPKLEAGPQRLAPELTGAMNRGEEDAQISEKASEEMERRIREHEEGQEDTE